MKQTLLFVLLLSGILPSVSHAGKIEKGFERLAIYDYFDAKAYFEKGMKKHPSPAAYGLATIYYRTDNPFHNLDSAIRLIEVADSFWSEVKERKREKWAELGFDSLAIAALKDSIAHVQFLSLKSAKRHRIKEFNAFIEKYPNYFNLKETLFMRDSIEFDKVLDRNRSADYAKFMEEFPESEFKEEAQRRFLRTQYREQTAGKGVGAYVTYMENHPQSPHLNEAQDEIYRLSTKINSVETLSAFIEQHPNNRNVRDAWRRLYQVFMSDYSEERISEFQSSFPAYPFKEELEVDLAMAKKVLIPVEKNQLFGAMGIDGNWEIDPQFEALSFFAEGLAIAQKNGKYGFVNKAGQTVVGFKFDYLSEFESGRAVVELDGSLGMIDRTGKLTLPVEFEDIGNLSEGLIYAQKNGLYAYYDRYGVKRIDHKFDEAYSFADGKAKVEVDGKQAYIGKDGEFIVGPKYDNIRFFHGDLYVVSIDGLEGLIGLSGNTVVEPQYERIGELSNGLAMVIKDELLGYADSTGQVIIPMEFEVFPNCLEQGAFRPFSALAKYKDKYGLIDRFGKFVIPNDYLRLGEFSTIMAFNKGKLWGYIDLNNKVVLPPKYDWAESFKNGSAIVDKGGMQGVINLDGEEIIPVEKEEVLRLDPMRFQVQSEGRVGVISADGKVIAPVIYQEVRQLNKEFYVLSRGDTFDYLYLPENRIIRLNQ